MVSASGFVCTLLFLCFAGWGTRATGLQDPTVAPVARVGPQSVWNPSAEVLGEIRQKCGADPDRIGECFLSEMRARGASAEAIAFARSFADNSLGYLRAFRDTTGKVGIAYVEYVFRANETDGVFLVNGDPPAINVDDPKFLSQDDLRKSADYAALLQKYPNLSIWPGDRFHTKDVPIGSGFYGHGVQELSFEYLLQDGCHACARAGTLIAGFDFDASGRFAGKIRVLDVRPGDPAANSISESVRSVVGSKFSITLISNHTTGYSWRLVNQADAAAVVKKISDVYSKYLFSSVGVGGEEIWTFESVAKGRVGLDFEYVRPFEKGAAPTKTAKIQVEIE